MAEYLLTAEELADRLGVSPRTIIDWSRQGRIPEVRLSPRVRRFDYEAVVAAARRRRGVRDAE